MIKLTDDELKMDLPAALAETEMAIKALAAISQAVPEEAYQIRSIMRRAIAGELDRDQYKKERDGLLDDKRVLGDRLSRVAAERAEAISERDKERWRNQDEQGKWLETRDANQRITAELAALKGGTAADDVRMLRRAIGVMVPTICRCYRDTTPSANDHEAAEKTLARIDAAMRATAKYGPHDGEPM
jgi:hypothetical protein